MQCNNPFLLLLSYMSLGLSFSYVPGGVTRSKGVNRSHRQHRVVDKRLRLPTRDTLDVECTRTCVQANAGHTRLSGVAVAECGPSIIHKYFLSVHNLTHTLQKSHGFEPGRHRILRRRLLPSPPASPSPSPLFLFAALPAFPILFWFRRV